MDVAKKPNNKSSVYSPNHSTLYLDRKVTLALVQRTLVVVGMPLH